MILGINIQKNLELREGYMEEIKRIALVAHDNRKKDLIEWVEWNYKVLIGHKLICTGTTGKLVEEAIKAKLKNEDAMRYEITKLKSGPLGGDQQLGAMIAEGEIDLLIFLWDPMEPQPHDVDVKALLRIAVLYNIPTACNRSTADFMISSTLLNTKYEPILKDYSSYIRRILKYD
jgi:methylglyoxal synthase